MLIVLRFVFVITYIAFLNGVAAGGMIVNLAGDSANSTSGSFNSSVGGTLNDPFAYDPLNPTSQLPQQQYLENNTGFHANLPNGSSAVLSYLVSDGPLTLTGDLNLDVYGRNGQFSPTLARDDDFDIQLFNGNYVTPVATLENGAVPDTAPYHFRGTLSLDNVTFDRIRIVGYDTADPSRNYFTLMEVRANIEIAAVAVPEPSSFWMLIIGATVTSFGVVFSRCKNNAALG